MKVNSFPFPSHLLIIKPVVLNFPPPSVVEIQPLQNSSQIRNVNARIPSNAKGNIEKSEMFFD